jgi:hypothetical protein
MATAESKPLHRLQRFASTRLVDLNLLYLLNTAQTKLACRSMRLTELATAAAAAAA